MSAKEVAAYAQKEDLSQAWKKMHHKQEGKTPWVQRWILHIPTSCRRRARSVSSAGEGHGVIGAKGDLAYVQEDHLSQTRRRW